MGEGKGKTLKKELNSMKRHNCHFGSMVDEFGLHLLFCGLSAGQFPWHPVLDDIIKCGLDAAGFLLQLEPVRLDQGDNKRPEGIMVFLFHDSKDTTCSDTFSGGNLIKLVMDPDIVARQAEYHKPARYQSQISFC